MGGSRSRHQQMSKRPGQALPGDLRPSADPKTGVAIGQHLSPCPLLGRESSSVRGRRPELAAQPNLGPGAVQPRSPGGQGTPPAGAADPRPTAAHGP